MVSKGIDVAKIKIQGCASEERKLEIARITAVDYLSIKKQSTIDLT